MSIDPERRHDDFATFSHATTRIDMRLSLASRMVCSRGHTLLYLSLYEDEIASRLSEFLTRASTRTWTEATLADSSLFLEPTDVVIALSGQDVLVSRGGACSFPLYWTSANGVLRISTFLPVDKERRLSLRGLADSVAVVSVAFQHEPNLSLFAPLPGWARCRRAAVSHLSATAGLVSETAIDLQNMVDEKSTYDKLLGDLRAAFEKFGRRHGKKRAAVELSGGFDSTLAALAARRQGADLFGVSLHFQYYEFRFEDDIQRTVAAELGTPLQTLDGAELFAYTPPPQWPRLDEPATISMVLARDMRIARIAVSGGSSRILVGHGGDPLFSENMLAPVPHTIQLTRAAFTAPGWRRIEEARARMNLASGFLRRSRLLFLHDARLDVTIKETIGAVTITPFTTIDVARCGMRWARFCAGRGVTEGKRVLADAFAIDLPKAVIGRRGKVSWDGVCARTYAKNADAITRELERASSSLSHFGFDVRWLVKRVGALARWECSNFGQDDREVFAAYALATWLNSWGLANAQSVIWDD